MITSFKIFENGKFSIQPKIGDIVYARKNIYDRDGNWIKEGQKLKIYKIEYPSIPTNFENELIKLEGHRIRVQKAEYDLQEHYTRDICYFFWFKQEEFITELEWESNKYNL